MPTWYRGAMGAVEAAPVGRHFFVHPFISGELGGPSVEVVHHRLEELLLLGPEVIENEAKVVAAHFTAAGTRDWATRLPIRTSRTTRVPLFGASPSECTRPPPRLRSVM